MIILPATFPSPVSVLLSMKIQLRIGEVELAQRLARGTTCEIWRAVQRTHGLQLALKLLPWESGLPAGQATPQNPADTEDLRSEFIHDIRTITQLSHPGIVAIYDFQEDPPRLAMELAPGTCRDLQTVASWGALRDMLLQILDALAYLHARNITHCDIKPDNILRFRTPAAHANLGARIQYKLTDFGIAHHTTREYTAAPDHADTYRGSPQYSAPEQILGDIAAFGPWTDLYALGCLAYECASGAPPFTGGNFIRLTMRHLDEAPAPLCPRFALPHGFHHWVARLLQKDPTRRYQSAQDAAARLREITTVRVFHGPTPTVDPT